MTGTVQVLAGAASGGPIAFVAGLGNTLATAGVRSGTMTLVNDGTSTASRSPAGGSGVTSCGPWYFPNPTTGVGSLFWCKWTTNTTNNSTITGSAVGSVISIGGSSWTVSNSGTGVEGTGTATISVYADAGGTILVATGAVSWDVGFAP